MPTYARERRLLAELERQLSERQATTRKVWPDVVPFVEQCCRLRTESGDWEPFALWDAQRELAETFYDHRQHVWLKARQLGLTWLALACALHHGLHRRPGTDVLLFSRREKEAKELLRRLKGMHDRLPEPQHVVESNASDFTLDNGTRYFAFPSTVGDSYTASLAIIDEADIVENLDALLRAVKPTVNAGGRLVLLSRSNKSEPESPFKKIYRAAKSGANSWYASFLPWSARPDRTQKWYDAEHADSIANTGALDYLYEQYPATDVEALAPAELDKRIPSAWVVACLDELRGRPCEALPMCTVYDRPRDGRSYVIGGDPAEGNPNSDPSCAVVGDAETGEHVATLAGQIEPTVFAGYVDKLSEMYNGAPLMCERNNHGHCVIAAVTCRVLKGEDRKPGWLSNAKGKAQLYTITADALRDGDTKIHGHSTAMQLASIEGGTLRAPKGLHDDEADAYALMLAARQKRTRRSMRYGYV